LVLFWTVGAVCLAASWWSAVAEDRIREAPTCSESQLFTSANCRITLDGTMISRTHDLVEVYVGGRQVSAAVTLKGELYDVSGMPVRVTLYRGEPIHIAGKDLEINPDGSPAHNRTHFLLFGMASLIGGTLLVGVNALNQSIDRRQVTPTDRTVRQAGPAWRRKPPWPR
jgi:hypothetical protein